MRLSGKTALIVGGTTGIGLATARLFLREGARVAISGRDPERLQTAATALDRQVAAFHADQRDLADIGKLAEGAGAWAAGLDVLLVNAGISRPARFGEVAGAFFDEHFAVNVRGPFFTVQAMLHLLQPGASVVMTTSCLDQMGRPGMAVYAATKAALRSLVRTLAAELVTRRIRVNAVAPGPIDSGIHAKMGLDADALAALRENTARAVPMGRFGTPEEVAQAVLFLASDASSFVTGHELLVDGGWASL